MIFGPDMAKLVLSGKKTQTRRLACRYREGRVYAIQPGRGRKGIGQITVLDVREERLGSISLADIKREGFRTTVAFEEYWKTLNGSFDPDLRVHVISFVKGDQTDRLRLLAARTGPPGGDYTDIPARAMRGEGEAVPARVQERFSKDGEERDAARMSEVCDDALRAIGKIVPYASGRGYKKLREAEARIRTVASTRNEAA